MMMNIINMMITIDPIVLVFVVLIADVIVFILFTVGGRHKAGHLVSELSVLRDIEIIFLFSRILFFYLVIKPRNCFTTFTFF